MKNLYVLIAISIVIFSSSLNAQWIQTNGPYGGNITCFAESPNGAGGTNLFAGTGGGVFLSTNNGTSWTTASTGLPNTVTALAVSPDGAGGTNLFAGAGRGVFLSTNNGTSWTTASTGIPKTYVTALAVSPNGAGGTNLFAGTGGFDSFGVFLSTNNGASWIEVNNGLTNLSVRSLAVSGTNLFAGTWGSGVFLSTNNGTSWTAVDNDLTNTFVRSLTVSGTNLFAGTYGSGVFLSTNNGTSWTEASTGLPTNATVTSFTVIPNGTGGTNLFAGTDLDGVFLSTNNGTSWSAVNTGLTNTFVSALAVRGSDLFAGTSGGVWRRPLSEMITSTIPTAGLQMWLRADEGVDTLNGTVSNWHDQSGNGNDVIQTNTSRQPLLVANTLNGKPVLHFDGLNDKLGFTGTSQMTQFSLFLVINNHQGTVGNTGNVITFGAAGDFSHQWYMGMFLGPDTIGMGGSGNYIAAISPSLAAYDTWRNLSVATTGTLWNTTLQWNGSDADMVPTAGSNFAISAPLGDATGSGGGIGGADGVPFGTILAKCDVAEVIVYNRAVTDSERLAVENYLNEKYNIENPVIPTAGLQMWLKADEGIDTLNGTVSRWRDQSGNGNDVIQTNTSRQPLLVANTLNGKPVLHFDGLNDKLGFTGTSQMTQFSLFLVINNHQGTVGNTGNVITFGAAGDFSHQWYMGMFLGPDTIGMGGSGNYIAAISPSLAAYDTWRNLSVATTGTLWNTTLQWNGSDADMVPTAGSNFAISAPLGDATGSGGGIGGADGVPFGTILAKCDVAEVIVYNRAVTDSERLAVENYLADKYNISITTGIGDSQAEIIPEQFTLSQNYPNPFNPTTTIQFQIATSSFVNLKVYDILGKEVATLVNEEKPVGNYEVNFNASRLASGVYFYTLQAGKFTQTKKLVLMK